MTKKLRFISPASAPRPDIVKTRPNVEWLEARIAPAAVATPATFSYTDGDGDVVQVTISGAAGSAEFLDAGGGDVHASGGDLAKIVISKPSADFSISFADTNAVIGIGTGDNVIDLGKIVGAGDTRVPLIKGIFTAESSPSVSYRLGGYYGIDFSSGGGLNILGNAIGDALGATTEVDLKSLAKGASISFQSVQADASLRIAGKVSGSLSVAVLDGDVSLGPVSGNVHVGHIAGALTLESNLSGRLQVGDSSGLAPTTTEEVFIKGSVLPAGVIQANQDLTLHVTKSLSGSVFTGGSLDGEVGGGMNGAGIVVGGDITIEVAGAVNATSILSQHSVTVGTVFNKGMTGSSIVGGTGLSVEVTGAVAKSTFSGGTGSMDVAISGNVLGSQLLAGGDAIVVIGGAVLESSIFPDGRLTLTVGKSSQVTPKGGGGVFNSIIGSKSTSATVDIGGATLASQFSAGTDLDLVVSRRVSDVSVLAANDLIFEVSRRVTSSKIAVGSDADVTIGGQLAGSSLLVGNNLDAQIGEAARPIRDNGILYAGIVGSRIKTSDGSLTLHCVGPILKANIASGQHAAVDVADLSGLVPGTFKFALLSPGSISADVILTAPGDVGLTTTGVGKASPKIRAGHDVIIAAAAGFGGTVSAANDLTLGAKSVGVPVGGSLRVAGDLKFVVSGDAVVPLIDVGGSVKDFRVGGGFSGGVKVGGDFVAGTTGAAATVVGGSVSPSTFLQIGGDLGSSDTAPEYIFGKGFKGRIGVGGDVVTDLTFKGAVNRVAVGGRIGAAIPGGAGDAVADIVVNGRLTSFTSASLFHSTSAKGGQFLDAAGSVTGAIQVDAGALTVGPFLI